MAAARSSLLRASSPIVLSQSGHFCPPSPSGSPSESCTRLAWAPGLGCTGLCKSPSKVALSAQPCCKLSTGSAQPTMGATQLTQNMDPFGDQDIGSFACVAHVHVVAIFRARIRANKQWRQCDCTCYPCEREQTTVSLPDSAAYPCHSSTRCCPLPRCGKSCRYPESSTRSFEIARGMPSSSSSMQRKDSQFGLRSCPCFLFVWYCQAASRRVHTCFFQVCSSKTGRLRE